MTARSHRGGLRPPHDSDRPDYPAMPASAGHGVDSVRRLVRALAFGGAAVLGTLGSAGPPPAAAGEATAAVAMNFLLPLRSLAAELEARTDHTLRIVAGSTGQLYAQITNGAPYDLLLSADAARPQRLEEAGLTVPGTRRTYALGRIALWSAEPGRVAAGGADALRTLGRDRIAIADPAVAPLRRRRPGDPRTPRLLGAVSGPPRARDQRRPGLPVHRLPQRRNGFHRPVPASGPPERSAGKRLARPPPTCTDRSSRTWCCSNVRQRTRRLTPSSTSSLPPTRCAASSPSGTPPLRNEGRTGRSTRAPRRERAIIPVGSVQSGAAVKGGR